MAESEITLHDLDATAGLAAVLAGKVRPGAVVLLEGPLGAGKTAFARAFLRALTGDPGLDVPSPTFTLVQSYDTPRGPVHHLDLWRLPGPQGLDELGWDELLRDIVLVEWPDRLGPYLPQGALGLRLSILDAQTRRAGLIGWTA